MVKQNKLKLKKLPRLRWIVLLGFMIIAGIIIISIDRLLGLEFQSEKIGSKYAEICARTLYIAAGGVLGQIVTKM